jgi:DNA-binding CsgD family transcriptional regulator
MLTKRESEIVALIKQAKNNKDIAIALGLSHGTVRQHLKSVFIKLNVKSRAELIIKEL